jgi:hypothetical protein
MPKPTSPNLAAMTSGKTGGITVPALLLRQLREGRMVLFAGAGLSAQAGLPTWHALLTDVIGATVAEAMSSDDTERELQQMLDAGKLLQVADHCKDALGPGGYTQLLAERLGDGGRQVPEAHRLAVRLPFAAFITTNYDKLLERAYAEVHGGLPRTLTNRDTEALGRLLFDRAPFILKAHGDLDKPDSLVFTSRDYRDLIHGNAAFNAAFSAILQTHSVLFAGYSLADPDFNLLMDRQLLTFRGFAPERYALMSGVGPLEVEYLWRVTQIRVIGYPDGEHAFVPRFFSALGEGVGAIAPVSAEVASPPSPKPKRSVPAAPAPPEPATVAPPLVLSLAWRDGAVRAMLSDGTDTLAGPVSGTNATWKGVVVAARAVDEAMTKAAATAIAAGGAALAELISEPFLRALGEALQAHPGRHVALALTPETERLPWELLSVGTQTLAEAAPLFRRPVGVSAEARGLPPRSSRMRALVIADPGEGSRMALPEATVEAKAIIRALERRGITNTEALIGPRATFEAFRQAFATPPDIVHFAGHAWFDEHEAFLILADEQRATASMLRPWMTMAPPTFMFLNSHYTAFIPPGVDKGSGTNERPIRSGPGGRAGFADIAMRSGVAVFLGGFGEALSDLGAKEFAISVYRELLGGATAAEAVQRSRRLPAAPNDMTPYAYALHGEGHLRLMPPP